jgi:hypothetical protein
MLKEWWKFFQENRSLGTALILAFLAVLFFAPVHLEICPIGPYQETEPCVRYSLITWFFNEADIHSGFFGALATGVIAWFTWTLKNASLEQSRFSQEATKIAKTQSELMAQQTEIIAKQKEIARLEFLATHRPKIRVKHVWPARPLEDNKRIAVDIVFTNVGDAPAIITGFGIDFNVIDPDQRMPGNMTPGIGSEIVFETVGLGDTQTTRTLESGGPIQIYRIIQIQRSQQILICFGFFEYTDDGPEESRKHRRTSFCREFVPVIATHGNGRYAMLKYPDPDYEYED